MPLSWVGAVPAYPIPAQPPWTGIGRSLTGVILAVDTFIPGRGNLLSCSMSSASTTREIVCSMKEP